MHSLFRVIILLLVGLASSTRVSAAEKHWNTPFGDTEPQPGAFHGKIYQMPLNARQLPDFENLRAIGDFYASSLWVKNQETFPWHGLPASEWYAIDYRGVFWLPKQTHLKFFLYSDDGSKLYIDDVCVIDNDGVHSLLGKGVRLRLPAGLHRMRLSYFQGPAPYIALQLAVQLPGQEATPFNLQNFLPPEGTPEFGLQQRPQ